MAKPIRVKVERGVVVEGGSSLNLDGLKEITEGLLNKQSPQIPPPQLLPLVESIQLIITKIESIKPGESKDYTEQLESINQQIQSTLTELEAVKSLQTGYNANNQSLAREVAGYKSAVDLLNEQLSTISKSITTLLTQSDFNEYKTTTAQTLSALQSAVDSANQSADTAQQTAEAASKQAGDLSQAVTQLQTTATDISNKQTALEQSQQALTKRIDELPSGGQAEPYEPEYVIETGEIELNNNGYPFTSNKVMFKTPFVDIPHIDVMVAYTKDKPIPVSYFSYALYGVDNNGFHCRITGMVKTDDKVVRYKAVGKIK